MENTAENIALSLFVIAGPIVSSMREDIRASVDFDPQHPELSDLTFNQLGLLIAVQKGKDQVGKLAKAGNVSQPAVSKMVDDVVNLGLLRRDPHPDDRRQIVLSLTEKGRASVDQLRIKAAARYLEAIENLSHDERQKIFDGIQVIIKVIAASKKE